MNSQYTRRELVCATMAIGSGLTALAQSPTGGRLPLRQPVITGDLNILRFSLAAEMVAADMWSQIAEAVNSNAAYADAMRAVDPFLPNYVLDTATAEQSHFRFLEALWSALGQAPLTMSSFATLDNGTGSRRLTNLSSVNIDTSWYNKYRRPLNPDVDAATGQPLSEDAQQLITLRNRPLLPTVQGLAQTDVQAMAAAALLHASNTEQQEASTYLCLAGKISTTEILSIMGSIMPIEMAHYTAFQTSLARMPGFTSRDGVTFPDMRSQPEARTVIPVPAPMYTGLPPVSAVRPRSTPLAGATATLEKLIAANIFDGQPMQFFQSMRSIASQADAASRSFVA